MTDVFELFNTCLYIQDNLDADLSLLFLAQTVGLSRFRFHRVFKAWRGETLHDFVTRMRMERAAFELRYPLPRSRQRSIKSIAIASGYKSLSSFSHAFSMYTRLSPREFRKQAVRQKPRTPASIEAARESSFFGSYSIRVGQVAARELTILDPPTVPSRSRRLATLAELAATFPLDGDRYGVELLPDLLARATRRAGSVPNTPRLNCLGVVPPAYVPSTRATLRLAAGRYAILEGEGSFVGIYRAWRRGFDRWLAASGECPRPGRTYVRFTREGSAERSAPIALFVPLEDLATPVPSA